MWLKGECSFSLNFQAAKPKPTSGSEKENKPGRTPEALSEEKKTEYQLLKDEIARYIFLMRMV